MKNLTPLFSTAKEFGNIKASTALQFYVKQSLLFLLLRWSIWPE